MSSYSVGEYPFSYYCQKFHYVVNVTLPFLISRVNFLEISLIDVALLVAFILFWIVSLSFNSSMTSPDSHNSNLCSKALKWSFDFDFCEGFCSSKLGITIIALNAISFSGESRSYSLINLETSPITFLSAFPVGNRNGFFSETRQFHKLVISSFETHDLCTFPRCTSRSVLKVICRYWRFIGELRVFYRFSTFTIRRCVVSWLTRSLMLL